MEGAVERESAVLLIRDGYFQFQQLGGRTAAVITETQAMTLS